MLISIHDLNPLSGTSSSVLIPSLRVGAPPRSTETGPPSLPGGATNVVTECASGRRQGTPCPTHSLERTRRATVEVLVPPRRSSAPRRDLSQHVVSIDSDDGVAPRLVVNQSAGQELGSGVGVRTTGKRCDLVDPVAQVDEHRTSNSDNAGSSPAGIVCGALLSDEELHAMGIAAHARDAANVLWWLFWCVVSLLAWWGIYALAKLAWGLLTR